MFAGRKCRVHKVDASCIIGCRPDQGAVNAAGPDDGECTESVFCIENIRTKDNGVAFFHFPSVDRVDQGHSGGSIGGWFFFDFLFFFFFLFFFHYGFLDVEQHDG